MRVIRSMPYPPSFSNTAARTMDPAIGASTWALGNHRCSPYSGIFTMKAIIHANHMKTLDHVLVSMFVQYCIIRKFREPTMF